MKLILKLLVPYFTVGVCWCIFKNGWLAILAYHALVLLWNRGAWKTLRWPCRKRMLLAALPTALAGPLLYFILPIVSRTDLGAWLDSYGLSGWSLALMIPYFGIIHPLMEQLHWAPLREQTPAAHLLFAGYHMMVLVSLLKTPWLVAAFITLVITSIVWQHLTRKSESLAPAILSHILADLGVILTAAFIVG
jgi:hypothetical protein